MKYTNKNIVGKWFKTYLGKYYIVSYNEINKEFTLMSVHNNHQFTTLVDIATHLNMSGSWRIINKFPIYEIY